MPLIEVEDLQKTFSVAVRRGGQLSAVRALLARAYREVRGGRKRGLGFSKV